MIALLLGAGLAAAAALDGVVLDDEGELVPGATVYAWNQRLSATYVTADSLGRFTFAGLPAGIWRLRAVPPSNVNRIPRFMPDERDFCASEAVTVGEEDFVDGLVFALPPGATVSGTIEDGSGAGVAGAVVAAVGAEGGVDGLGRAALTNSEGRFEVVGIEAFEGGNAYRVEVQADGFPDQLLGRTYEDSEALTWVVEPEGSTTVGTHTLLDGIMVSGLVQGPDGPVDEADVIVYGGGQIVNLITDATGIYEAVGLAPGDVLPWAGGSGLATTYWPDVDRPTTFLEAPNEGDVLDGADLFLPYEAIFQANFVDAATGAAVGPVQALLYNDAYTVGRGTRSDDDELGLLQIDELFGGTYFLYVWAESIGYTDGWVLDEEGDRRPFEVTGEEVNEPVVLGLGAAGRLSGVVRDDEGEPLAGASVVAVRADGSVGAGESDDEGAWSIGGLGEGTWELYANLESYCPGDPTYVTVYHPQTVNVDWQGELELAEGEQVSGLNFELPVDEDQDAMGDRWEATVGLDPTLDDAGGDPDGDGYINLVEYRLGTDPFEGLAAEEGCTSCSGDGGTDTGAAWLILLLPAWMRRRR